MNDGQIDADLGEGVIKQRIARPGAGKSGGSRSIILFRKGDRTVYVHGYEKKDQATIKPNDLGTFQSPAKVVLNYTLQDIADLVRDGQLFYVGGKEEEDDQKVS